MEFRLRKYLYISSLAVLLVILLTTWRFGILGSVAEPIAERSSSSESCEIIYRDSCGQNPIAVNEKYSFLYGHNQGPELCDFEIDPVMTNIETIAGSEDGKCIIEKKLKNKCRDDIINITDSSKLEDIRINRLETSQRDKLSNMNYCWSAYKKFYR